MCNKSQDTDPSSPRLFECEYMKIIVGDNHDGASGDLSSTDLTDLLVPINDEGVHRAAIPTLLGSEKERYLAAIDCISAILFECDPMCINYGSNSDEYEPQATTLLAMLQTAETVDEAIDSIQLTFNLWFSYDLSALKNDSKYLSMAQRIWAAWSENRHDAGNERRV